jgi:hypothetical protein
MASVTSICNRGLQLLGAARILDITDDTRNGRACNACYDSLRQSEIRKHRWRFAITRTVLAPLVETDPHEEFSYIFQLPADCLKVLKPENNPDCDWQIEGRKLFTNDGATLPLRYLADITDPNIMDSNFREMLSAKMGEEMCEEITQSNSKIARCKDTYKDARSEAKMSNAFETIPATPEDDSWVLARQRGVR